MSSVCRASVFIATSLDGFIAKTDGSVDWLNEANSSFPEGEDQGFQEFMNSVDALVMGRKTFESVLSMGVAWPYGDTPVVVLSRAGVQVPDNLSKKVTVMQGNPKEVLAALQEKIGAKDVYVDGGETIRRFIDAGTVSRIIITTVPVTLGEGKPLLTDEQRKRLRQLSTKTFSNGFVKTIYQMD